MAAEDISSTGQVPALGSTDFSAPYQSSDSEARAGVSAAPAARVAAKSKVAAEAPQPANQPTQREIDSAIAAANANLASSGRMLDYTVDAATGISIAVIRNSHTGAVLQQIPGANIMALARMLADWAPGKHMLLDLIA
jgi:uncharacterized FlaG/YvyC family protein